MWTLTAIGKSVGERCFEPATGEKILDFFLNSRGLTGTTSKIVELRATHITAAFHLDGVDGRAVGLEHALDALTVRDLADRE